MSGRAHNPPKVRLCAQFVHNVVPPFVPHAFVNTVPHMVDVLSISLIHKPYLRKILDFYTSQMQHPLCYGYPNCHVQTKLLQTHFLRLPKALADDTLKIVDKTKDSQRQTHVLSQHLNGSAMSKHGCPFGVALLPHLTTLLLGLPQVFFFTWGGMGFHSWHRWSWMISVY